MNGSKLRPGWRLEAGPSVAPQMEVIADRCMAHGGSLEPRGWKEKRIR